jgi:glycosyltransferase involved in cell wall biosynthesis
MDRSLFRNRAQSILFVNPDYHCTFFYQQELNKIGWRADVLVLESYPDKLLYDSKRVIKTHRITSKSSINYMLWILSNFFKYKYIVYYGKPIDFGRYFGRFILKSSIEPVLSIIKFFRTKIVYMPAGCNDEFTQEEFIKFDHGNVCGNCGFFDNCNDVINKRNLRIVRRYADLIIGSGFTKPHIKNQKNIKWKSFDLDAFNPNIKVPNNYLIPKSNTFKILHSTSLEGRDLNGKNIKGSDYIVDAVERLIGEGFNCELIRITDVTSVNMKYIQVQSDLIIDQLIYGHWGSTSLEGIALGKPVICYFNKEWKENYIDLLNIQVWPFIEADTDSIYTVLRNLLTNPVELKRYSEKSLDFAHKYLDVKINAEEFIQVLGKL